MDKYFESLQALAHGPAASTLVAAEEFPRQQMKTSERKPQQRNSDPTGIRAQGASRTQKIARLEREIQSDSDELKVDADKIHLSRMAGQQREIAKDQLDLDERRVVLDKVLLPCAIL
jgi:hypothetical protein